MNKPPTVRYKTRMAFVPPPARSPLDAPSQRTPAASPGTRRHGSGRRSLSVIDAVCVLVGVVVGVGIFGFPPMVARYAATTEIYLGLWIVGGLVMLIGALCYAELGSAYPDHGGEYLYLNRAWGPRVALLFAWARGTVMQTGGIAVVAFLYGGYAQQWMPLGRHGIAWHAGLSVIALTLLNMAGARTSRTLQRILTALTLVALIGLIAAAAWLAPGGLPPSAAGEAVNAGIRDAPIAGSLGMGMVFVLLTFGGWNEAAYLSGELRNPARNVSRVLFLGTGLVAVLYILTNLAFLRLFGLEQLREADAIGLDVMRVVAGPYGAWVLGALICCTALTTMNATIMTGARVYAALGRDVPRLAPLARWSQAGRAPIAALLLQAALTLLLVLYGAFTPSGVEAMVAVTAPAFWLFMTLVAGSVWRLRRLDPDRHRPFRVPGYPFTPMLFALTCAALAVASALYAGAGTVLGLLIVAAGWPLCRLYSHHTTAAA